MRFTTAKLKWAKKLLKAKYFIVLTDKESAIALQGADPAKFRDAVALSAQAAELSMFRDDLNGLIDTHQQRVEELIGGDIEKPVNRSKKIHVNTTGKAKKPNVAKRKAALRKNTSKKVKA